MKIAIFLCGISGSGKTTWAKDFVSKNPRFFIVSRDDIRASMCPNKVLDWKTWSFSKEKEVTNTQLCLIENLYINSTCDGIIVADTNLGKGIVSLMDKCASFGYEIYIREFDISLEEAISRDSARNNLSVGKSVIEQQYIKWQAYKTNKPFSKFPMLEEKETK